MEPSFKNAAAGQTPAQPVITCDWHNTLFNEVTSEFNYDLLETLSNARKAGYRVIITSSCDINRVEDSLYGFVQHLQIMDDKDIIDADEFDYIDKNSLKTLNLKSFLSFDDQPIRGRGMFQNYIVPTHEVTVGKNFNIYPWSYQELGNLCAQSLATIFQADYAAPREMAPK